MSDLQKIDGSGKLDLNFRVDGEEKGEIYVQIDLNMQAEQGPPQFLLISDIRIQYPVIINPILQQLNFIRMMLGELK